MLFEAAALVLGGVIGSMLIWVARDQVMMWVSVALATTIVLNTVAGIQTAKGTPAGLTVSDLGEVEVLSATWQEGESIWLWVRRPGVIEPIYVRLPYDKAAAEQLHKALTLAEETGTKVKLGKKPGGKKIDGDAEALESEFYADPVTGLPPKEV